MKKSRKITVAVLIVIAVLVVVGLVIRSKKAASDKGTVVRIENAEHGELIEFVSAPGEIEPKKKVEISAKVTARIIELPYDEGDVVTRGDPNANPPVPPSVLIRMDAKELESQLLQATAGRAAQAVQIEVERARTDAQQASLSGLSASLKQAETDLARQQGLLQSHDISQATFDQTRLKVDELMSQYEAARHTLESARLNLQVMQHNLEAADAKIAQARETLSYTTIVSPIDGVVTRLNAEVGEMVMTGTMNNPGTVIMVVADLSKMLVVAQVDEADVGKLEVGQKAKVYLDAYPDHEFKGVVDSIALSNDLSYSRTKYFKTEILLDPVKEKLPSGLTANVDIETRKHSDVLKVPTQAVLGIEVDSLPLEIRENSPEIDKNKTFATVVYRYVDGKAVVTPVKIGQCDLTHTIVESGITEKDRIVVGPYKVLEGLKHDQKIQDEREVEQQKKQKKKKTKDKADVNDVNNVKQN